MERWRDEVRREKTQRSGDSETNHREVEREGERERERKRGRGRGDTEGCVETQRFP